MKIHDHSNSLSPTRNKGLHKIQWNKSFEKDNMRIEASNIIRKKASEVEIVNNSFCAYIVNFYYRRYFPTKI